MKQVGWYSKIVLTVIAVSLLGLLMKPVLNVTAKSKTQTEYVVMETNYQGLAEAAIRLGISSEISDKAERMKQRLGVVQDLGRGVFFEWMLEDLYAKGYRIKFITDDFVILEAK